MQLFAGLKEAAEGRSRKAGDDNCEEFVRKGEEGYRLPCFLLRSLVGSSCICRCPEDGGGGGDIRGEGRLYHRCN